MAIALQQRLGFPWDDFRRRLIAEIERDPQRPYYESWLAALEALTADLPAINPPKCDSRRPTC